MTVYKLFYTTGGVWWHQQYEWSIRLPLNTVWKKWVILLRTPNKNILVLVIKCEIILHHFCKLITTGRKNSHRCYIRMERLSNWIPSGFVNVASRNLPSLEMQQERREWNNQSEQNPHDEFSKSCHIQIMPFFNFYLWFYLQMTFVLFTNFWKKAGSSWIWIKRGLTCHLGSLLEVHLLRFGKMQTTLIPK